MPGGELLTALRGKDIMMAFVESYGRVAVEDPGRAAVDQLLDAGTTRALAAGFGSRSGFLTSSTVGGGSWLAHSTLVSGLWINNQQRYRELVASDRLTLTGASARGLADGNRDAGDHRAWPEGVLRLRPGLRRPESGLPGPPVQLRDHARPVHAVGVPAHRAGHAGSRRR